MLTQERRQYRDRVEPEVSVAVMLSGLSARLVKGPVLGDIVDRIDGVLKPHLNSRAIEAIVSLHVICPERADLTLANLLIEAMPDGFASLCSLDDSGDWGKGQDVFAQGINEANWRRAYYRFDLDMLRHRLGETH